MTLQSLITPENAWLFAVAVVWSLIWKGWALWYAARRSERGWFLALLIINTMGLLEIIYIFLIARKEDGRQVYVSEDNEKEDGKRKIMAKVEREGRITNDEVEEMLAVSDATATRYLSELAAEGKLHQEGETGRGVCYTKK